MTLTTPLPSGTGAPRLPQPECKGGVSDGDWLGMLRLNSSLASYGVSRLY